MSELAVARRERLAIPFIVLDDRWLSLIKVKQERRLSFDNQPYGRLTEIGASPAPNA